MQATVIDPFISSQKGIIYYSKYHLQTWIFISLVKAALHWLNQPNIL